MGGKKVKNTPQDVIDYLNELCPQAMALGMSLDEYWHGDPNDINFYVKADEVKLRKLNNQLWVEGAYIYYALCCASPMFNSLAKDHKPKPYLKEPFAMSKQEEEERFIQKVTNFMDSLVGKQIKNSGKEG